jgi:hypothetical protein
MQKYCLVENCRYSHCHLTESHLCSCGEFGHGIFECGNHDKKEELLRRVISQNIIFPSDMYCTIQGCNNRSTHNNESHICSICGRRNHGSMECKFNRNKDLSQNSNDYYKIKCPSCRSENRIQKSQKKIVGCNMECIVCGENANMFLPECGHINICLNCIRMIDSYDKYSENQQQIDFIDQLEINNTISNLPIEPSVYVKMLDGQCFDFNIYLTNSMDELKQKVCGIFGDRSGKIALCAYAGMGCHWYIKRESVDDEIQFYFMHSDAWGQYGFSTSNVEELNNFLEGCQPLTVI